MNRILIAEDETRIASFVEKGLRSNGFATSVVGDGRSAYDYASSGEFDLVVLDLGLPVMDGYTVLRRLREDRNTVPVVVLTARDTLDDTLAALEGGADDYMAKPFRFDELLARIRLRLKAERMPESTVLEVFMRHSGQVLSREQLLSHVWGYDYDPGSNVVDVYVGYLRKKLGTPAISTVRGMGYRFNP